MRSSLEHYSDRRSTLERVNPLVKVLLFGLLAVCGLMQVLAAIEYFQTNAYLEGLANGIVPASAPPSVQAVKMLEYMRDLPVENENDHFLLPIFSFLRWTPRQVAENGGDCSARS